MTIFPITPIPQHPRGDSRCAAALGLFRRCSRHTPCAVPTRRGFTLVEVLLTLCLLVVITGLVWPRLEKSFNIYRLRKAADIIRTHWSKARVEAMSTGSVRLFRFEIEGNRFRIEAQSTDPNSLTSATTNPLATDSVQQFVASENRPSQGQSNFTGSGTSSDSMIPKDVVFLYSQSAIDSRSSTAANALTPAATATPAAGDPTTGSGAWSEPIYFYPDGSTSTARVMLRNKEGLMIEILLRGLTGTVKIGNVTSVDTGGIL